MTEGTYRAPGRVNLIGDHTDYNGGFVLPMAIQLECVVVARSREHGRVHVTSREAADAVDVAADGSNEPREVAPTWGRYVAGVVRTLAARGRAPIGIEAAVHSTVPVGSGLSSSAALEVSLALALAEAGGLALSPLEFASACQEAEHIATGVPCGIMDQLTSVAGRSGHALLIDCRSNEIEPVPLPEEVGIVVVDSGVQRSLDATAYAERREACEATAKRLGVASLRDATAAQVADEPRARHVVSENVRVLAAAAALRAGDLPALGRQISRSHESLRDDFEVSTPELDALTGILERAGAFGARLTGAGFGGCVVAVTTAAEAERIAGEAVDRYDAELGLHATATICTAAPGAGRVEDG